jgi:hypothetical protein
MEAMDRKSVAKGRGLGLFWLGAKTSWINSLAANCAPCISIDAEIDSG